MNMGIAVDVALGMALTYLLVSLFATTIQELVSSILGSRAEHLKGKIAQLIGDEPLANEFFAHPLVRSLFGTKGDTPSYIPAQTFALVVQNIATAGKAVELPRVMFDAMRGWAATDRSRLARSVESLARDANGDIDRLMRGIETWYDQAMDRLSGTYKRRASYWAVLYGTVVAIALNVNTFAVLTVLATEPGRRAEAVAAATAVADGSTTSKEEIARALPIGWSQGSSAQLQTALFSYNVPTLLWMLGGWMLTGLAASLGSTFWFDTLKRIVNLRNAGPKPASSSSDGASPTVTAPMRQAPVGAAAPLGVAPLRLTPPPPVSSPGMAPLPPRNTPPKPSAA